MCARGQRIVSHTARPPAYEFCDVSAQGLLDVKSVRKLFQTVALVGPAVCMLFLAQGPETSKEASALFTAAVALGSCSSAGFGSSVQDLRARVRATEG